MATILFSSFPAEGHFNPKRPIVQELSRRGHEVLWYTGAQFAKKIEAAGAVPVPMREGRDVLPEDVDELIRQRGDRSGVAGLQWDFEHLFIDHALGYRKDLEALYASRKVELVVSEVVNFATNVLAPANAPPLVGLGVFPLGVTSRDTAPFGPGLMPDASMLGRLRNHVMNFGARHLIFGPVQKYLNQKRKMLGMAPITGIGFLDHALLGCRKYLQGTVEEFEYPRTDLAPNVEFIGPLLPSAPSDFSPPAWWDELGAGLPVVLVTQGTIAKDPEQLIIPTLEALRDEPVLVVVTAPSWSGPEHPPKNARIAQFLPYSELLPRISAVVTNGGYGGVQFALSHGVPLVVAGVTEEKAEINARVAWSGVGIDLKVQSPSPEAVRNAVRRILHEPAFRANARRIQQAMAKTNAPVRAADCIETLL